MKCFKVWSTKSTYPVLKLLKEKLSLKKNKIIALCLCLACPQKLASVSPELPKLIELLTVHRPKENEILLVGGLDASETCQTHPRSSSQVSWEGCLQILSSKSSSLWSNCPGVRSRERKLSFCAKIICDLIWTFNVQKNPFSAEASLKPKTDF